MDNKEFLNFRKTLSKTQKQMAQLLGTSIKAVHSYEQGWRKIPTHAERQVLFLVSRMRRSNGSRKPCWTLKKCPLKTKRACPAWEFQAGDLCWFINGTICENVAQKDWNEKIKICRSCEVLSQLL